MSGRGGARDQKSRERQSPSAPFGLGKGRQAGDGGLEAVFKNARICTLVPLTPVSNVMMRQAIALDLSTG